MLVTSLKSFVAGLALCAMAAPALSQGTVVLMGIDAEDGGVGGHGPIVVYQNVVNNVILNSPGFGVGILVIGGGKDQVAPVDDVTEFWDAVSSGTGQPVTYVNGAAAITGTSFAPFKMIAIVSDFENTPSGGLTQAENNALAGRAADIAAFVNSGRGLLGFSQTGMSNPYAYFGTIGGIVVDDPPQYDNITPTAEGLAAGITNALDVCCWHDHYVSFPSFLKVLATNASTTAGSVAAIGGATVTVITNAPSCEISPSDNLSAVVGVPLSFTVQGDDPDAGDTLTISVISGLPAGATFNPVLPTSGPAPLASTFQWTPALADAGGSFDITIQVKDQTGLTAECVVHIRVDDALAIDLAGFDAHPVGAGAIEVRWLTAGEVDHAGFNVYRLQMEQPWLPVLPAPWLLATKVNDSMILATGSPTEGSEYDVTDTGLVPGSRYLYWLESIDIFGEVTLFGPIRSFAR